MKLEGNKTKLLQGLFKPQSEVRCLVLSRPTQLWPIRLKCALRYSVRFCLYARQSAIGIMPNFYRQHCASSAD